MLTNLNSRMKFAVCYPKKPNKKPPNSLSFKANTGNQKYSGQLTFALHSGRTFVPLRK